MLRFDKAQDGHDPCPKGAYGPGGWGGHRPKYHIK